MSKHVVVLDYGSGNVRSVVRMLERVGADVELSADPALVGRADGLYVPGVGNFHACMAGLDAVGARAMLAARISAGAPVLGVCVGLQVLFEGSTEPCAGPPRPGLGHWSGTVELLRAPVVPHMGWSGVQPPTGSTLFEGVGDQRFYFVHSYAAHQAPVGSAREGSSAPAVAWTEHGERFVAAVEDGPLSATQFHPEKSGDAGAQILRTWLSGL